MKRHKHILVLALAFICLLGGLQQKAVAQKRKPADSVNPRANTTVREYAALFFLSALHDETFDREQYEIRVWYGFSNFSPSGFLFSRSVDSRSPAYVISVLKTSGLPTRGSESYEPPSEANQKELEAILEHLLTERFAPETGWGDPDAISVAIEVRKGKRYRVLKYSIDTMMKDGLRFLEYAAQLERACGVTSFPRPTKPD